MRYLLLVLFVCLFSLNAEEQVGQDDELDSMILDIRSADSVFYEGVLLFSKNAKESSELLKQACELKHPGACLYVGNYYEQKNIVETNTKTTPPNAQRYYKMCVEYAGSACLKGATEWCSLQGVMMIEGKGVAKDVDRGIAYLQSMCEMDSEHACAALGTYYFHGNHIKQDLQKAKELHQKALALDTQACNENRMYACMLSGEIYQNGLSVQIDIDKAKEFYKKACALHNRFACDYVEKLK